MRAAEHKTLSLSYEIFILVVTLLSLYNLAILRFSPDSNMGEVAAAADELLSVILFSDFCVRLWRAPNRAHYLIRGWGWADLIGSLVIPYLRLFRIPRIVLTIRALMPSDNRSIVDQAKLNLSQSSFAIVAIALVLIVEFGSVFVLNSEEVAENPEISTGSEAVWWSVVTLTTVGYGDFVPETSNGRYMAVLIMAVGIALVAIMTGFFANLFLSERQSKDSNIMSQEFVVLSKKIDELHAEVRLLREDDSYPDSDQRSPR